MAGNHQIARKVRVNPAIRSLLPPISFDGPYGVSPKALFDKDVALLIAVGSKVVLCASILKSVWYRTNFVYEKTSLRKVYLYWLCDDLSGLEWFKSLAMAIEAQVWCPFSNLAN